MADYNATAYGIADSRKSAKDTTTTALRNADPNKGQKCMRFQVAAGSEIMGGEIWVNKDTVIAANDTFTITATAG
jgi:hypothetical protein